MPVLYMSLLLAASSGQSLFAKLYSEKTGTKPEYSPLVFNIWYSLIIAFGSLAVNGFSFSPSPRTLLFATAAAAATTVYNVSIVRAAQTGPYPIYMISALFGGIIIPSLFCTVFFSDPLSLTVAAGAVLMLVSVVLLTYTGSVGKLCRIFIVCCVALFLSNGTYGTAFALQARTVEGENAEFVTAAFAASALVSFALLAVKAKKDTFRSLLPGVPGGVDLLLSSVSSCAAQNLHLLVLGLLPSAVVFPVLNGGVLVVVTLLSIFLFREKLAPSQWIGVGAAAAGIVLMSV